MMSSALFKNFEVRMPQMILLVSSKFIRHQSSEKSYAQERFSMTKIIPPPPPPLHISLDFKLKKKFYLRIRQTSC